MADDASPVRNVSDEAVSVSDTGTNSADIHEHEIEYGHDFVYNASCSPCSEDSLNNEAGHFCRQCNIFMCNACLTQHNRFPINKQHIVTDAQSRLREQEDDRGSADQTADPNPSSESGVTGDGHSGQSGSDTPWKDRTICPEHPEERLNVFCETHEDVCCNVCISTGHRTCHSVITLKQAIPNYMNKESLARASMGIDGLCNGFTAIVKARQTDRKRVEVQKSSATDAIDKYRRELNKLLDKQKKFTTDMLTARYGNAVTSIDNDIEAIQSTILALRQSVNDMQNENSEDKVKFISMIQSLKLHQAREPDLSTYRTAINKEQIEFRLCGQVKKWLSYLTDFGEFADEMNPIVDKPLSFTLQREAKLWETAEINDVHMINKQLTIAAMCNPNRLVMLDEKFEVKKELALSNWKPNQICEINSNILAVALEQSTKAGKILLVSADHKMKEEYSFYVGPGCRGVAYCQGMLYVSRGGRFLLDTNPNIHVFNLFGSSLRVLEPPDLSIPRHIVASPDKRHVLVADEKKGLVKLDPTGDVKSCHRIDGMKFTNVIAQPRGEHVFFIDNRTNVFYMDKRHDKPVLLLQNADIANPRALYFDHKDSTLIVFSDKIVKVFKLD